MGAHFINPYLTPQNCWSRQPWWVNRPPCIPVWQILLHDIGVTQTFSLSEYLNLQRLPVTCRIQPSIFTMTYRLLWFGSDLSDLLLLQTPVLTASPSPPTHNVPAIRIAVCFLDILCSVMFLYLAKWWFLLPKWLFHWFPSGKIAHVCQDPGQNFIFSGMFFWLLGRINFLFPVCIYGTTWCLSL